MKNRWIKYKLKQNTLLKQMKF